ncbi:putative integral membrane protein, MMPL family [Gordonia polyisoprenivorans VH2]|uniref:Putative integral membrane protein, MMPL family n=1 Tax=Gordonia polyisoprenivorans (strain DSM 44266 / VH2) TaxID=1112204 RepID=H6MV47_GORPV|nr:MMPL family transporter [Gordonia polyisoprenivorans]AFA71634.1 putative integral membrane protein, MMPL family [Gordonia polyisoprenivorans VH2]
MFGAIGTFVYRMRFAVIAVLVVLMGGLGLYGLGLSKHLSQSGWFDPTSQSSKGSVVADTALGRDHRSDVILLITAPPGTKVTDPQISTKVEKFVDDLLTKYPTVVQRAYNGDTSTPEGEQSALRNNQQVIDPFFTPTDAAGKAAQDIVRSRTITPDQQRAFISIGVAGNDDTTVLNNFKTIEPFFDNIAQRYDLPAGTTFQLAGLQPVAGAMARGMDADIHRAEIIALPLVALMLFFIFGGVIAACLPVFIGGLTIAGSLGIMNAIAQVTELNIFAQSVVTLIGLGIAIDYGLFIVSRFREELAEGYSTKAAVRRTVMTAGQTVVFSATIIVAAIACLLIMPQGFLKSVAYGAIASVSLAAILSITVLPALLGILGPRVDAFSLRWMLSYTLFPIVRKFSPSGADRLDHRVADLTGRTKSREEIENGFWGRLSGWVMKHPVATAVPTVLLLLVLTIPFGGIKFGGISEQYLPPDNPSRVAQEAFDKYFPTERTEDIKLVIMYDENNSSAGNAISQIADEANKVPGFTKKFSSSADDGALTGSYGSSGLQVLQMSAGLVNRDTAGEAIKDLRKIDVPSGMRMWVAGTPALTQDSIDALLQRLPLMALMLVLITGLLMFLAFGSVVLPIKAALMSVLGLGATLGILTWIFVDGHGAGIANFTPGPLFAAVLVLIIAIVFGLSTDYEIFLLSRMVEARQRGASTTEAIRVGTALTGRIITAAAAILVVVTGAFGLSEIVMMKYIAYGMIAALILDATIIRMLLVPSVMKLLGDDCWWAPRWMRTLQRKIGLGEIILDEEPDDKRPDAIAPRAISAGTLVSEVPTSVMAAAPSAAGTRRRAGRATPQTVEPGGPRRPAAPASAAPPSAPNRARPERVPTQKVPAHEVPAQKVPTPPATARRGPSAPPSGDMPAPRMTTGPRPGAPRPVASAPADAPPAPPRRYSPNTQDRPDTGGWSLGEGGIRLSAPGPVAGAAESPSAPNTSGAPGTSGAARSQPPSTPQPPSAPRPRTAPPATGRPQPGTQSQPGHRARPDLTRRPPTPPSGPPPGSASGPQPGPGSPLSRRPELDQTGQRPLAASLSPEERSRRSRPAPTEARPDRPSPMDRGLSQGSSRLVPPRSVSDPTTADPTTTADVPDPAAPGRAGPDRSGAPSADDPRASSPGRDRTASDRHARDTEDDDRISVHDLLRRSRSGQTGD